jgi:filamin
VDARGVTSTGTGKVQCELLSPSGKRQLCPVINNGDGTYTVQYVPNEIGPYELDVTFDNVPIPGSVFRTQGMPGCDPNRVRVYGPGLEGGITQTPCMFTVETKGCGQGSLSLAIEGPSEAKMICKENQNGTCIMEYLPLKAGPYDISIKYADRDVPGSPFRVIIEDKVDSNKVNLQMPKKPFRANVPSELFIDARDAGKADVKLDMYDSHGRVKPVQIEQLSDGMYKATVTPTSEGPHRIDCKWNGASISNCPMNVNVLPTFEPYKVKVDGAGIRNGVAASLATSFTIDTRDAGVASLDVSIKGPEGNLIQPRIEDNHDGTYVVHYVPEDVGRSTINVLYGGQPVNNSPFSIKIDPIGDAKKCHVYGTGLEPVIKVGEDYTITVDTRDAGQGNVTCHIRSANGNDLDIDIEDNNDGTFNIYYTPHNPGSYMIKIKFGGQDIPNGDLTVTVSRSISPFYYLDESTGGLPS